MVLTLSKWFLIELAQKISEVESDGSVSIPIYGEDENEFQVVCEFNLQVHYGEREENTGWRNVDTVDFCVTYMYVAWNGEPMDISVDWNDSDLHQYVRAEI